MLVDVSIRPEGSAFIVDMQPFAVSLLVLLIVICYSIYQYSPLRASSFDRIPTTYNPIDLVKLSLLAILPSLTSRQAPSHAEPRGHLGLIPLPAECTTGHTPICLSPDFSVSFHLGTHAPSQDLVDAATRIERSVKEIRHEYLSTTRGREFFLGACEVMLESLILRTGDTTYKPIASIMDDAIRPVEDRLELEAYTLDVPLGSQATLTSDSALGLFRGLTTFRQLFYSYPPDEVDTASDEQETGSRRQDDKQAVADDANFDSTLSAGLSGLKISRVYAPLGPYHINDKPSFGWRAFALDTSRHFFSKAIIKKQLDVMAMVKLNVFHW